MKEKILEVLLSGDINEFKSLLNEIKDISFFYEEYSNNTLLHLAVINNNISAAEVLISNGIELNKTNSLGKTSLHYAISNLDIKMVELLMDNNADIHIKDIFGNVPLFYAISIDLFGHSVSCNQESVKIIQSLLLHSITYESQIDKTITVNQGTVLIIMQGILHAMLQENIIQDMYYYIKKCNKSGLLST